MHEYEFHQSWLSTYLTCPEQARLVMAEEYPPDKTEAAAKGTAVHAGIELVLTKNASYEEALEVSLAEFDRIEALPGFEYVKTKRKATCLAHVSSGLQGWFEHVLPTLPATVWCEEPFKFKLHEDNERVIWIAGTVDYADAMGLRDWKLTANKDKYGKREGWKLKRFGIQPTVYSAAAFYSRLYDWDDTVPFTFVALDPMGRAPQLLECERTWAHVEWLRAQCISIAEQIEAQGLSGPWPLNDQSALCSPQWCRAWGDCKGKHFPH